MFEMKIMPTYKEVNRGLGPEASEQRAAERAQAAEAQQREQARLQAEQVRARAAEEPDACDIWCTHALYRIYDISRAHVICAYMYICGIILFIDHSCHGISSR